MCHVQPELDFGKVNSTNRDSIRKASSVHYASGVGDFMQSLSVCTLDYGAFLNLSICNSDSWRGGGLSSTCQGASEDCFEVCFVGLVVGGNYI